jgi:hypothetical protein
MSAGPPNRREPPLLTRELLNAFPQIHERLDPRERGMLLAEEELDHSLARMIDKAPAGDDIWVFGYGSLIWNPIFPVAATRTATIRGYHRSLCMNSIRGRGSIDNPGAMLALDAGGACRGIAMKIGGDLPSELKLLWRREMLSGALHPKVGRCNRSFRSTPRPLLRRKSRKRALRGAIERRRAHATPCNRIWRVGIKSGLCPADA